MNWPGAQVLPVAHPQELLDASELKDRLADAISALPEATLLLTVSDITARVLDAVTSSHVQVGIECDQIGASADSDLAAVGASHQARRVRRRGLHDGGERELAAHLPHRAPADAARAGGRRQLDRPDLDAALEVTGPRCACVKARRRSRTCRCGSA